ncbi:hypothetical protein APR51_09265 [Variovorax paradoxus]|jgi:predicted metal-dependent phosphoesterase TrpH|nr:hypothetical protein APR52_10450 [Variovorax paradoxus]KPV22822.1 hypothetical protein APR51_09265 [Variovorax paradoxus]
MVLTTPQSFSKRFLAVACAVFLASCGGGSGNGGLAFLPPPAGQGTGGSSDSGGSGGAGTPDNPNVRHAAAVSVQGDGSGDVESLDTTLACHADCSADYAEGASVKLIATAARGSVFDGWQGACEGTEACELTMDQARNVVAKFSLAANAAPTGTWFKGDTHVHDDHSDDGSAPRQLNKDKAKGNLSLADQIGQAGRTGLDFVPFTDHRTYDQHYDPLWESSSLLLIRGEEANGKPHAIALGGVDSVEQGAMHPDRAQFALVQQSVWDAHAQGAIWSVAHADDGETNADGSPNVNANVQGVNLVEVWNRSKSPDKQMDYAENRWNAGFRFGVAGASDNHFREYWGAPYLNSPGMPVTKVLAKGYNERGILEALRAGYTSLSINPTGPGVSMTTDLKGGGYTAMSGDEVFVPAGTTGHLRIGVQRAAGMDVLLFRMPGKSAGPMKTFKPTRDDETYTVDITAGSQPDWYRVEVRGINVPIPPAAAAMELKAAVSPIFVSPAPVEAKAEIAVPKEDSVADGALRVAGARGDFAGFPDLVTADGVTHVVTEMHGDATSTVVYRRRDAKGVWSDAGQTLSGKGQARFPRVAVRGNDVWVAWEEDAVQVPHRPVINLRHSADGGATWASTDTVRSLEGRAEHPDVAVAASGKPVLAWQEIRADQPFDIMVQEVGTDAQPRNLSRAGKSVDAGVLDDTRSPHYPASVLPNLTVAADGRVAVAWQDNRNDQDPLWTGAAAYGDGSNPDDWQVQVAVRDAAGAWKTPVSLGATDRADRHPDVIFGGNGDLVVAWESKEQEPAGKNIAVLAAVSGDGGATFSAPTVLAAEPTTMSQRPRLGVDKDGSVRVVWFDSRSADWRWRVMTAVYRKPAGWDTGTLLKGTGINTWPVTSGGVIAFASTRNATRLQRDPTQQVFLLAAK